MKSCEILATMSGKDTITLAVMVFIALCLTLFGGKILEFLKRRSNTHPVESQVSRHEESRDHHPAV